MKIIFLVTVTVDTAPKPDGTFNEGEVYDMNDASARFWIGRGMADEVPDIPVRAVEPETATAPPVAEQAVTRKKTAKRKTRRAARKQDN